MDRDLEQLRELVAEIGPADDRAREAIRTRLVAEAGDGTPSRDRRTWLGNRGVAILAFLIAIPAAVAVAGSLRADVVDNFEGFLSGDSSGREIGRPIEPSDNPPKWFNGEGYVDQLVIASNGQHDLFMARDRDGIVSFSIDDSGAITSGWGANPFVNEFKGNAAIPLFGGPMDDSDRLLYSGVIAPDVASLELRYSSGPPDIVEPTSAGFIFLADLGEAATDGGILIVDRRPTELVALDADGDVLQSQPAQCVAGMPVLTLRTSDEGFGDYFDTCEDD